jgi:ketosteroid isomerase-like protein
VEPEQIFRSATAAVVRGDFDAAAAFLHEDVVFDMSRSRGPLQGVYTGPDEIRQYWQEMYEAWKPVAWDVEPVGHPDSETVVLESMPRARGRGSGIELQGRGGLIVRVRDEKLVSITLFQSPEEASQTVAGQTD